MVLKMALAIGMSPSIQTNAMDVASAERLVQQKSSK
jgi:hypothetical protein